MLMCPLGDDEYIYRAQNSGIEANFRSADASTLAQEVSEIIYCQIITVLLLLLSIVPHNYYHAAQNTHLESPIHEPFFIQLLENPPHALHEGRIQRFVVILKKHKSKDRVVHHTTKLPSQYIDNYFVFPSNDIIITSIHSFIVTDDQPHIVHAAQPTSKSIHLPIRVTTDSHSFEYRITILLHSSL